MKTKKELRILTTIRQRGPVRLMMTMTMATALWGTAEGQSTYRSLDEEIVESIRATAQVGTHSASAGVRDVDTLFYEESSHRKRLIQDLLSVLTDPKSPNESKCYSAYYLGVLHATAATETLAAQITNQVWTGGSMSRREAEWRAGPSYALFLIGAPAIPALLRNLAEKDDPRTRQASLRAVLLIENDKDVVQLRLQKALKAEPDPEKQARLQAAIKALADPVTR
jgi:hypothetical protein